MSEMVKQVKLALFNTQPGHSMAIAAIRAMREPTPEVIEAVKQAIWKNTWGEEALKEHWRKMIDAALGEP